MTTPPPRRRLAALALLGALAAACRGGGGDEQAAQAVVGAQTATAVEQAMPVTVSAIGTVVPRPGALAELSAPAPTRVARVFVAVGQSVAAGDSLVEFERAPFEAAALSAEVAAATARRAAERAARLAQQGILPRKEAEQAAAELSQAEANLVTAHRALELATLRAPMAAVVTDLRAAIGSGVDPSQLVVRLVDPSALEIVLGVSPGEAGEVRAGHAVSVSAGQGPSGESLGSGVVVSVGASVDSVSRAVAVRVRLGAPRRVLRVGESVFGRIAVAVHSNAVVVPAEALVPQGEEFHVFVVDSAGIAHLRPVTVGARSESLVEILTGLSAGEVVVTYGAFGVEDGARVVAGRR